MPATPTTVTELNELVKDYWSEVYQPQMNTDTALKAQFGKLESVQFTGRKWIFGIKTAVGGGAANAGANKSLPNATQGTYDQGEATLVRTYVRAALDLFLAEITKKQTGSYRPAIAELMEDRIAAINLEKNRQMFSAGDGKLANTAGTSNSGSQVLQEDFGVTNGGTGTRHVHVGDQLAFRQSSGTLIGRRTVTAVAHATRTVTLDSAVQPTAGGFVSKSTSDDDNYAAGEAKGLLSAAVQTGTFQAVPVAGRWLMPVYANGGTLRPMTDTLGMTAVLRAQAESKMVPDLGVTRPGIVQKYSETFLPLRRINGQETTLKGGYKPVAVFQHAAGEIPIMTDLDCPESRLFFLNTGRIKMLDLVGEDWADADGAEFSRIDGKDGVEGYVRSYWNMAWTQLNCHVMISDLEDVSSIDRLGA